MGSIIDLNGDVAVYNAGNLHEGAAELASQEEVSRIEGYRVEPAADRFGTRLEAATAALGDNVERLRAFVTLNAVALTKAVTALTETDRMNADAAAEATALIDELSTPVSGSGSPTSAPPSQSSSTSAYGGS